jgi:hypothetical protein
VPVASASQINFFPVISLMIRESWSAISRVEDSQRRSEGGEPVLTACAHPVAAGCQIHLSKSAFGLFYSQSADKNKQGTLAGRPFLSRRVILATACGLATLGLNSEGAAEG